MDGVPILRCFRWACPPPKSVASPASHSTTNVVLTEIEKGRSFEEAIRRAQQMGIAETDPSADLDGWDAAVKVAAMAIVLLGVPLQARSGAAAPAFAISAKKKSVPCELRNAIQARLSSRSPRRRRRLQRAARVVPRLGPARQPRRQQLRRSFRSRRFRPLARRAQSRRRCHGYGLLADFIRAVRE